MNNINIVIIGNDLKSWYTFFLNAAKNLGVEAEFISAKDIVITIENSKTNLGFHQQKLDRASHIIFLSEIHESLYHYITLIYSNKRILNGESILNYPNFSDKFLQGLLIKEFVSIPETKYSLKVESYTNQKIPILLKKKQSISGKGLKLFNSYEDLLKDDLNISEYESQEFLDSRKGDKVIDYRTVLLGYNIVGSVQRVATEGFKTNGSKDSQVFKVPTELGKQFVELCKYFKIEECAIDYTVIDDKAYIFEVNRFPYFGLFQQTTNIDFAQDIIKYLIQK